MFITTKTKSSPKTLLTEHVSYKAIKKTKKTQKVFLMSKRTNPQSGSQAMSQSSPGRPTKRVYRRTNVKKRSLVKLARTVNLGHAFPQKLITTLRYTGTAQLVTGTSLVRQHFACNGLYDPDTSGTGHQPAYFDQLNALYNHYVVLGSKIRITFQAVDNFMPLLVCGLINDDSTAITGTTVSTIAEQTQAKTIFLSPTDTNINTMHLFYSAKKVWGSDFIQKDSLQGTGAANPTELQHYDFYCMAANGSGVTTVHAYFEIEYICLFRELKEIAAS